MRLFSGKKVLITALLLLIAPLATNAYAEQQATAKQSTATKSADKAKADQAKSGEHAKSGAHGDHGEKKKSFPLGAVSFAFLVLGVLAAPAYHRLNVGGDFTGAISSREDSGGH